MKKTFPTRQKRDWKDYNNQPKQRTSLQIWLRKEVINGWTKGEVKGTERDEGRGEGREVTFSFTAMLP